MNEEDLNPGEAESSPGSSGKPLPAGDIGDKTYFSLADQLPVGVYRTSTGGQLLYANPALTRILDYDSVSDLMKLNVNQLYENPSERLRQLEVSLTASAGSHQEFQLKKKSGDIIWVRDKFRLVCDRDGKPLHFDGIIEDITDAKNTLAVFKKNEANLKAIIENTLESIWSIDRNYEIQYINEVFASAFQNTFGIRLSKGVRLLDSLPENIRQVWKDRYDRTFNNEHFVFEDRVDAGESSIYIEVAMNPIVVDGKVVGGSFYAKDVTEKKISQLQLQFLSDLRQLLMDLSTGFINLPIMKIPEAVNQSLQKIGSFVGADRAYVFDYDFQNNIGSNTYEWCSEGTEPQIQHLQELSLEAFGEWTSIHKSGHIIKVDNINDLPISGLRSLMESQNVISLLTIPLLRDKECIGFVGFDSVKHNHTYSIYEQEVLQIYAQMLVNVKERLEKEEKIIAARDKAEESDRLKSAFLANMSHEIRTPMNGIIGFLDLLREPDLSEENKAVYIDIVTKSGYRLLDTINDIIEVSRIETGEMKICLSLVNINELMAYYHGFFKHEADLKGLSYKVISQLPDGFDSFTTDRNKLESIITNLLKNAVKFTTLGSVEFGCRLSGENLVFWIRDTGVGIAANRKEIIFERFVQADLSNTRPHEGSGLGLSIVKAYIEALNGSIVIDSEPGKGSTFTFSIPPYSGDVRTDKKRVYKVPYESPDITKTILITEDDYSSYLYLEKVLSTLGVRLLHTTNGFDAIKAVKEVPGIVLIIMDIKLPGLTGLETTQEIRKFNADVPVIAQTAYALAGDRELALDAGCNDYISKPIKRDELIKMVKKYL